MHCEEPAMAVDGLRAIFWHQYTKETGGHYWVSSTQKHQGSVIKVNSKPYLKTRQMSEHLHATEDKIRDDYIHERWKSKDLSSR